MNRCIILVTFFLIFISCTQEIARVDMVNQTQVSIQLRGEKNKQIDLYVDCDMEYTQPPVMVMDFEFYKGKNQLLKGGLDPLVASPKTNEIKTKLNGVTHWKFYGKLEGNFIPPSDTIFTIYPTLIKNNHPDLVINKFELVLVE